MRVQPDERQAVEDRSAALQLLNGVLRRVITDLRVDEASLGWNGEALPPEELSFPGIFAAAYDAQACCRSGAPSDDERTRLVARLGQAVTEARASVDRAGDSPGTEAWRADLAPPAQHLHESLARAVAQAPKTPERAAALDGLHIGEWDTDDRAVFDQACALLEGLWPAMLGEVGVVVRQVALLQGYGIDGFTDVATHGAIYVNRTRLRPDEGGLPGPVRLAEAIVHEATHNSCNAAALSEPFLADGHTGTGPVVMTPLRRDARPLTGLFQQLVVLARCTMLYDRLLDDPGRAEADAMSHRREKLHGQGRDALRTIGPFADRLTDRGRSAIVEADEILGPDRQSVATGGRVD